MDNFRITQGFGVSNLSNFKTKQDKGHKKQFELLVDRAKNGGRGFNPF